MILYNCTNLNKIPLPFQLPTEGSADKRTITTGTFGISKSVVFLPMQLIYGGKTTQSIPKFKFPKEFSLSAYPKPFSNTEVSLKLSM